MNKIYQQKHELWLHILFTSFAINDQTIKSKLYDFSQIAFRHMKWLGRDILESGDDYNYDRNMVLEKHSNVFEALNTLKSKVEDMQSVYPDTPFGERAKTDDTYILEYISQVLEDESNNKEITAFNMKREWPEAELDSTQTDALTLFLFEETYKEYELILVYAYMQARTKNHLHFNVFQDLIDESHFHLKSFGEMLAKLGILALPRELHEMTYVVKDLEKFVKDGIAEEEAAKEMCKQLSQDINEPKLSSFFDFINYQESYHIELMKKLL